MSTSTVCSVHHQCWGPPAPTEAPQHGSTALSNVLPFTGTCEPLLAVSMYATALPATSAYLEDGDCPQNLSRLQPDAPSTVLVHDSPSGASVCSLTGHRSKSRQRDSPHDCLCHYYPPCCTSWFVHLIHHSDTSRQGPGAGSYSTQTSQLTGKCFCCVFLSMCPAI